MLLAYYERDKMKYMIIQRNSKTNQAKVTIPKNLDEKLRENGVDILTVKIEDGKLVYTPVKVVE